MAFFRNLFSKPAEAKQTSIHPLFEYKGIMEQVLFEQLKLPEDAVISENKAHKKEEINQEKPATTKILTADVAKLAMSGVVNFDKFRDEKAKLANQFLQHVALGEQDLAEHMLQQFPDLLFSQGIVTDYSERTFLDISGFEYAVWALDSRMWTMFLNVINTLPEEHQKLAKAKAKEQLESLEKHGLNYQINLMIVKYVKYNGGYNERPECTLKTTKIRGEKHYNFELLTALKKVLSQIQKAVIANKKELLGNEKEMEAHKYWAVAVGGAQRLAPAHVMQEMCSPHRSFLNEKSFNRKENFQRNLILQDSPYKHGKIIRKPKVYYSFNEKLSYIHHDIKLGAHYAIACDYLGGAKLKPYVVDGNYANHIDEEFISYQYHAMNNLYQTRLQDLEDLKNELEIKPEKNSKFFKF